MKISNKQMQKFLQELNGKSQEQIDAIFIPAIIELKKQLTRKQKLTGK